LPDPASPLEGDAPPVEDAPLDEDAPPVEDAPLDDDAPLACLDDEPPLSPPERAPDDGASEAAVPALDPPPSTAGAGSAAGLSGVAPSAGFERAAERSRASFFAQPEPRKTTAGTEITFVIGPPQTSHVEGPCAWIPCRTSMRWPHALQAYS
jgi:hypothetical protein